jgi:DNA-binding LytR/AlgR family response regulator
MSRNITFLVLEDDVAIANTLKKEVEKRGFAALVAYTSKKARELVALHGATITHALFDIKLNRESIDGIQLAKEFKLQLPNLVVIFITAFLKDEGILERIEQIGEAEFVDKTEMEALEDILPNPIAHVLPEAADLNPRFALKDTIIVLPMYDEMRLIIPLQDIVFIKGCGNYCKIITKQPNQVFKLIKIGIELKEFTEQFQASLSNQHAFWKINRSTIINTMCIVGYSTGYIYFSLEEKIYRENGEKEELHRVIINRTVQSILENMRFKN